MRIGILSFSTYVLVTAVLTWPLVLHPGTRVPGDLGDPLLNTWLLWWNSRAIPLTEAWWNAPQFFPLDGVTAFSEHLLGLAVFTTPLIRLGVEPLAAYNLAFFTSFPLSAAAAQLLCYTLTRRHDASFIAGLAFGFAPYRMAQLAHVQVLSAYWMPLALWALHRYAAERRLQWAVLFAGAWLFQALTCGYYLFYFSALVGLWILWFAVGRVAWRDIGRLAIVWSAAALALVPVAWGYWRVHRDFGLRRIPYEIASFSADVASVLNAPANLWLWGNLRVFVRDEAELFPGFLLPGLVLCGAWHALRSAREHPRYRRLTRVLGTAGAGLLLVSAIPALFGPWRVEVLGLKLLSIGSAGRPLFLGLGLLGAAAALHPAIRTAWHQRSPLLFYVLAAAAMWTFSLGPTPTLVGAPYLDAAPYTWLMQIPGVIGVRVPARFWMLAVLCLSVAAGLSFARLRPVQASRAPRGIGRGVWVPLVFAAIMLVESWPSHVALPPPPSPFPAETRAAARLELPIMALDSMSLYRAIPTGRRMVNGYSGFNAPHYAMLERLLNEREHGALAELAAFGPLEVIVVGEWDPEGHWGTFVAKHPGAEHVLSTRDHEVYRLPRAPTASWPSIPGRSLPVRALSASVNPERLDAVLDGDPRTGWDSVSPQRGETLVADLGTIEAVTGVVLELGGFWSDYPRALRVDTSTDGNSWEERWAGNTVEHALAAMIREPVRTPIRIAIDPSPARFVRLRQVGADPRDRWYVGELHIFGR